jgi:hypothetical protein
MTGIKFIKTRTDLTARKSVSIYGLIQLKKMVVVKLKHNC